MSTTYYKLGLVNDHLLVDGAEENQDTKPYQVAEIWLSKGTSNWTSANA